MSKEKNFFHKVSEKLSKPNIFILNNRWDASVYEEFLDKVRKQHMDQSVSFLVDELKVVSRSQAENRVFFVSAKEALQVRLQKQKGKPPHAGAIVEGFQARFFEFQDFERKLQDCLSKSAVKTKFEQHTQRGKTVTLDLRKCLERVYEKSTEHKTQKMLLRKEQCGRLDSIQQQLHILTHEVEHQKYNIVESVEQKVVVALSEEIRRLNDLVYEFERPFHSDSLVLSVYKKELNSYVEQGLESNLRSRLSSQIQMFVESAQKGMIDQMSSLIPPEHRPKMMNVLPRHSFEVMYDLNCNSLCSDFQEDLKFKFRWGLVNIIKCYLGSSWSKKAPGRSAESVPWPIPSTPQTPSNEIRIASPAPEYLKLLQKLALASPTLLKAVGMLAASGFLIKFLGRRVIAYSVAIYGVVYIYDRMTWTNKKKEISFKEQYVNHATGKLRLIVDHMSSNCNHQVQQELSSTFARLCHLVDEVISDMQNEISVLDQESQKLDESSVAARTLRNKADYLYRELETFSEQYLQYDV